MKKIKELLNKYFAYFVYFYRHLGYRIFITMILSFGIGIIDGFGLTMFIPLLQMVNGEGTDTGSELGGMSFLVDAFNYVGISMTL